MTFTSKAASLPMDGDEIGELLIQSRLTNSADD
ncbi:hypothetical protein COLO4_02377 [Corchorus olitorius]|uniref:Uncharacterized protein n=1 Tax=Corchorus olitorius TaxID=93759 RepID=A0A1R3L119_9ROSI|nr:hypothetical protein COLO4_02377 [Corchorus olitorius]